MSGYIHISYGKGAQNPQVDESAKDEAKKYKLLLPKMLTRKYFSDCDLSCYPV